MNCPECNSVLRANAKSCRCGWAREAQGPGPHRASCERCHAELIYPRRIESPPFGNFIVGRSRSGNYLCMTCYQLGESFDYRDKAFSDFVERHKGDEWSALISMSRALVGAPKEDKLDFIRMLRAHAHKIGGAFGRLPYDPTAREPV